MKAGSAKFQTVPQVLAPLLTCTLAVLIGCGSPAPEVGAVYVDGLTGGRGLVERVGTCAHVKSPVISGYRRERMEIVAEEIRHQQTTGRRNHLLLNAPSKYDTIPRLGPDDDRTSCVSVTMADGGGAIYGVGAFAKRFSPVD